ncbi:MAG: NAD-dependent epimerase/dehydratase family protein [Candidatus Bathycorpusculaceae bacterium]
MIGIIGGSGFIGATLGRHLSKSFDVKVLDVKPPPPGTTDKVNFNFCDVRRFDDLKKHLENVDLVIHAAIVQIPLINEQKKLGYEVNILGTQNVCEVVDKSPQIKGMILAGSWHTIGERELKGVINEEFGLRPDKVEERARLYALSKIAQELIVRFYDEMSNKVFGIIRMGTVLGEGMPEKTAANIFIEKGLKGEAITPYKHSMHRPMLYIDINDVCLAFERYVIKVLNGDIKKESNSLAHIVNVYYPNPITILELAKIVQNAIIKNTKGALHPKIEVIDTGQKPLFSEEEKNQVRVDVTKAMNLLGLNKLKSPEEAINEIVKKKVQEKRLFRS